MFNFSQNGKDKQPTPSVHIPSHDVLIYNQIVFFLPCFAIAISLFTGHLLFQLVKSGPLPSFPYPRGPTDSSPSIHPLARPHPHYVTHTLLIHAAARGFWKRKGEMEEKGLTTTTDKYGRPAVTFPFQ